MPIYIVSANGDVDADAADADGFISKPVSARRILEAVESHLRLTPPIGSNVSAGAALAG